MFSMTSTANTSSGQDQLDINGATAQSPAPAFGSIPPPALSDSHSMPLSTHILDSTTTASGPSFDLELMDTSVSLNDMSSIELPTNPSATNVQPSNTVAAAKTLPQTVFYLSAIHVGGTTQALSATPAPTYSFSLDSTSITGLPLGTLGVSTTQVPAQPINIQQLIDLINNWTVSLENQEKQFLDQANEITVWENILTNQSTEMIKLYDTLKQKEKDQSVMEQDLKFLLSQQKELEDCLVSLEQELQSDEVLSSLNNKEEPIHQAALEIDKQVKKMSGDVKEIVINLNNTNSKKDSHDDLDTICRILDCHVTALQSIDHNIDNLSELVTEINEKHALILSAAKDSSKC